MAPPAEQPFWHASVSPADHRPLAVDSAAIRGQDVALVIMNGDGAIAVDAEVTVGVTPRWLNQTVWGVLILGSMLLMLGALALGWPQPRREVVYVVEPASLPELSARLGLPVPPAVAQPGEPTPATDSRSSLAGLRPPVTVKLEWPINASGAHTAAPVSVPPPAD